MISLSDNDEILFVGTAEAEHVEMYLKAIWHINERNDPVKISTIAKRLNVRQPSVVQMLKKLAVSAIALCYVTNAPPVWANDAEAGAEKEIPKVR